MRIMKAGVLFVAACVLGAGNPAPAQTADATEMFIEFVEAARLGDVATVNRLIADGQDVNRRDGETKPALYHALEARQFATARALIEAGADIKSMDVREDFALGWAARAGDAGIVKLMIAKGADPRAIWESRRSGFRGLPPVTRAIEWGRVEAIKAFEAAGVTWLGNDRGAAALALACRSGDLDTVGHLLAKGADVNAAHEGNVPLDYASALGDVPLMRLLLAKGARVDGVSQGPTLSLSYHGFRRTPLVSALMSGHPEAIRVLLKSGADAKALDNLPIKWADLLGDAEVFAWLRAAGAPEPEPFAYREWLPLKVLAPARGDAEKNNARRSVEAALDLQGGALIAPDAALSRETRFAIIATDASVDDMESLLAVRLSALDKAVVLERAKLRELLKERGIMDALGRSPAGNMRAGRLLGADALVILRAYSIDDTPMAEARIVSVSTGLVTATLTTRLEGDPAEEWAARVAARCRADGERLFTPPAEAKLVAVAPFTASLNNASSRELERQLGLLVALRLSRLPGVFLVEREDLARLQAEGRDEEKPLLNGSWIVQGAIEQSLNDRAVSLRLVLRPGGGGAARELTAAGSADATAALSEKAVAEASQILDTREARSWPAKAEAAEFSRQSADFFARRMWREAETTATAAWALGLRDDRVLRLRLQAAANRVLFATNYFNTAKRRKASLSGPAVIVSFRAPLLMPAEDDREPGADEYFEKANLMLDLLEPTLERTDERIAGMPYAEWVCGRAWDAATQALRLTEALSYRADHGEQRTRLQARLLAVNKRAIEAARAREDAKATHSLIAVRMKNLCWWAENDAAFQAEALRLLNDAKGWPPPLSEHAVWGPAFIIAKGHMAMMSGRASQSWVLLAREMAKSEDPRERFFGTALAALDDQRKARLERAAKVLERDFAELVELDSSIPARVLAISYKPGAEPSEGGPFECWYHAESRQVFSGTVDLPLFATQSEWKPVASRQRILPEQRRFYIPLEIRRWTLINERGPSGYFTMGARVYDTVPEEAETLRALKVGAITRFAPLVESDPAIKDATYALNIIAHVAERRAGFGAAKASITLKDPRLPFEQSAGALNSREKEEAMFFIGKKSFRDFSGNVWFGSLATGRAVFYGLDDQGAVVNETWGPPANKAGYALHIDPNAPGLADRDDRRLVAAGYRYREMADNVPCILAYDLAGQTWTELTPPQPIHRIHDVKLFGDAVVFTFLANPLITAAGGNASDDHERRGDPLSGVMRYDLATGTYELLVSNRRNPRVAPIDGPGKENKTLLRVSAEEFMVGGSETHVGNVVSGVWRQARPEDKARAGRFGGPPNDIGFDGARWSARFNRERGLVLAEKGTRQPRTLVVQVAFDDAEIVARMEPYEKVAAYYKRASEGLWVEPVIAPGGIALRVGPVYYWMPDSEVQALLSKAFKK